MSVLDALLAPLVALVGWLQGLLFEQAVQPVLFAFGLMSHAEVMFDFTEWAVIGALEIAALAAVMPWFERRFGVEPRTDRAAIRTDIAYTLLHRLGAFALLMFALLTPLMDAIEGWLRLHGIPRLNLDGLVPGVTDVPVVAFLIYLVVLDFADYWMHRAQHRFEWWWHLHAVHHSQRQMTFWTDQRNHLVDDLLRDAMLAAVALTIGAAPGQFIALVVATRVLESVQHANLGWRLGPLGRILVAPAFHRRHHAIGIGHEGPVRGVNFAVLFPWWDMMFGTADYRHGVEPTGIRDQQSGRDYGRGFWSQQWLALKRIAGRE